MLPTLYILAGMQIFVKSPVEEPPPASKAYGSTGLALVAVIDRLEWRPYSHGVILKSRLDYDDGRF